MVDYYGASTPLNQLASVTAAEARLLVVQPWDKQSLPAMEKAIMKFGQGLNPVSDGNVLRLSIPQLTEDRRKELVRLVREEGGGRTGGGEKHQESNSGTVQGNGT